MRTVAYKLEEEERISNIEYGKRFMASVNVIDKIHAEAVARKNAIDREAHVYLVDGVKVYYKIYRELHEIKGDARYLGIGLEPMISVKEKLVKKIPKSKAKRTYVEPTKPIGTIGRAGKFQEGMTCCYCENTLTEKTFTKEHVVPKRVGGNILMPCCSDCNSEKGGLMIHSYIQSLCYNEYSELNQTKIKNANEIAKKYNLY